MGQQLRGPTVLWCMAQGLGAHTPFLPCQRQHAGYCYVVHQVRIGWQAAAESLALLCACPLLHLRSAGLHLQLRCHPAGRLLPPPQVLCQRGGYRLCREEGECPARPRGCDWGSTASRRGLSSALSLLPCGAQPQSICSPSDTASTRLVISYSFSPSLTFPALLTCCPCCWVQHLLQLDRQYKLPKMRYKGDAPLPQFIRSEAAEGPQQQLISEVESGSEGPALRLPANKEGAALAAAAGMAPSSTALVQAGQKSQAQSTEGGEEEAGPVAGDSTTTTNRSALAELQHSVQFEGRPVEAVNLWVQLPAGAATTVRRHTDSLSVRVEGEVVQVQAPGCRPLTVTLPLAVTSRGGAAQLRPDGQQLDVRLPYMPLVDVLGQLRQQRSKQQEWEQENDRSRSTVMEID